MPAGKGAGYGVCNSFGIRFRNYLFLFDSVLYQVQYKIVGKVTVFLDQRLNIRVGRSQFKRGFDNQAMVITIKNRTYTAIDQINNIF